jgi:hypothetical protein
MADTEDVCSSGKTRSETRTIIAPVFDPKPTCGLRAAMPRLTASAVASVDKIRRAANAHFQIGRGPIGAFAELDLQPV